MKKTEAALTKICGTQVKILVQKLQKYQKFERFKVKFKCPNC